MECAENCQAVYRRTEDETLDDADFQCSKFLKCFDNYLHSENEMECKTRLTVLANYSIRDHNEIRTMLSR